MMRTTRMSGGLEPVQERAPVAKPAPAAKPVAAAVEPMISDDLLSQIARAADESQRTQRVPVGDSQRTQPVPREARRPVPSDGGPRTQPVPSDGGPQTEPMPDDSQRTQRVPNEAHRQPVPSDGGPHTEPMPDDAQRTQRVPDATEEFVRTQRMSSPDGDKTVKVSALDPNWRPEQQLPTPGTDVKDASTTQRLDDSIQRLQEAKRLLQNLKN
jgi:hypothetical protein